MTTAEGLQKAANEYKPTRSKDTVSHSEVVDFEHLKPEIDDDDDDDDDDHVEQKIDPDDPEADKKRKEQRDRRRDKFLAAKKKRDQRRAMEQKKIREDGDPYLVTIYAPSEGWYRVCVTATSYQVSLLFESQTA